jgi:hypothetical protein
MKTRSWFKKRRKYIELEIIILSEIGHTQKDKYIFSFIVDFINTNKYPKRYEPKWRTTGEGGNTRRREEEKGR